MASLPNGSCSVAFSGVSMPMYRTLELYIHFITSMVSPSITLVTIARSWGLFGTRVWRVTLIAGQDHARARPAGPGSAKAGKVGGMAGDGSTVGDASRGRRLGRVGWGQERYWSVPAGQPNAERLLAARASASGTSTPEAAAQAARERAPTIRGKGCQKLEFHASREVRSPHYPIRPCLPSTFSSPSRLS